MEQIGNKTSPLTPAKARLTTAMPVKNTFERVLSGVAVRGRPLPAQNHHLPGLTVSDPV
jgi:hypothetical protein